MTNHTLDSLRADNESALTAAAARRRRAHTEAHAILGGAERAGRSHLSAGEDSRLAALGVERRSAEEQIAKLEAARRTIDEAVASELAYARDNQQVHATGVQLPSRGYDMQGRVGAEERVYRPDHDPFGAQFARDICQQFMFNDIGANERLARHMQESRVEHGDYLQRSVGTGAFAGLTVPQYLTDLVAPAVSNLRPTANVCHRRPLPPAGMTLNISKITTPSATALQTTENSAVQNTDMDDTLLTINVQTAAGQQTVSRQAIERGTGVESTVIGDLLRRYAVTLDNTLLNQATTGLTNLAQVTTYTDASPTGPELYSSFAKSQSLLETALRGVATPDFVIMHPRRWNWLTAELTNSWPMISDGDAVVPPQSAGIRVTNQYGGVRGILPNGLRVITDANVGTTLGGGTEDEIFVIASDEVFLFEDPGAPVMIRAEQAAAATLGVTLVAYGYFAFAVRYANGVGKIGGSGLAAPAGF